MDQQQFGTARVLAEVLRLHRWAGGGEATDAATIYALANGFESALDELRDGWGVSRETQDAVEDVLEDVEAGHQSPVGMSIKDRLRRDGISETDAARVMRLCLLESRLVEGVETIAKAQGSVFTSLTPPQHQPESEWFGALHWVDVVGWSDETDEDGQPVRRAFFTPAVPRIGETIAPERGQVWRVVDVVYDATYPRAAGAAGYPTLIPLVQVEPIEGR